MLSRRLLDHDPLSGVTEYFHYDTETKGFVIETVQEVELVTELNKTRFNDTEKHTRYNDGMHLVATIPNAIIMQLAKLGICTPAMRILDKKKFKSWLNSSENQHWRVRAGRV